MAFELDGHVPYISGYFDYNGNYDGGFAQPRHVSAWRTFEATADTGMRTLPAEENQM